MTTEAPTIPVLAAMSMPTTMTAKASPPGVPAISRERLLSRFSAIRVFSIITPMKTNSGTAMSVGFVMMPNSRPGRKPRSRPSKVPPAIPPRANSRATPARVSATGYPASRAAKTARNMKIGMSSTTLSALATEMGGQNDGQPAHGLREALQQQGNRHDRNERFQEKDGRNAADLG